MRPSEHVLLGAATALALTPVLGPRDAAVFWGASVLIDVDHYADYVYRTGFRDVSLPRAVGFFRKLETLLPRPEFFVLNVLHTVEAFLLLALAGWWLGGSGLVAVLLGMAFHLGCDLARLGTRGCLFKRAFCLPEYFLRRRWMRGSGLDPGGPLREALAAVHVTPRLEPSPATRSAPSPAFAERLTDGS